MLLFGNLRDKAFQKARELVGNILQNIPNQIKMNNWENFLRFVAI